MTRFNYLANQNLGSITYANGSVTELSYNAQGNASEVTESAGRDTARTYVRTYDSDNRVTSIDVIDAAPAGATLAAVAEAPVIEGVMTFAYDGVGNLTEMVDETGLVTTMTYDTMERMVEMDDPTDGTVAHFYNETGEVVQYITSDDALYAYEYDAVSRPIQITDAEGFVKTMTYDLRDNIRSVTDGRGGGTVFSFDALDRMASRTNPLGQVALRSYDRRDNVMLAEDDDNRVTMTYDERNRLLTSTTDGSTGVQPAVTLTCSYDQLDRRTSMTDSLGGMYGYSPCSKHGRHQPALPRPMVPR